MTVDTKVHINRFLNIFSGKVNTDAADTIITMFDECIEILDSAMNLPDTETATKSDAFQKVYKKLLGIVPSVLALDESKNVV
jgi:hypothetical protein